ncbi:MAG: hypothetical protein KJ061_15570, partial [Vicinamibacteraceae bacterium]|nr:hypothetical protein [Vicinamibacteraceae bacterium]
MPMRPNADDHAPVPAVAARAREPFAIAGPLAGIALVATMVVESAVLPATSAGQTVIPLWPEGVPGAKAIAEPEREVDGRIFHVHEPALAFHPAPADLATGTAVIVCPGGGYARLAMANEGAGLTQRLNAM